MNDGIEKVRQSTANHAPAITYSSPASRDHDHPPKLLCIVCSPVVENDK